jgi:hypothetical protein
MAYFADTWFWAALVNKADPEHELAMSLNRKIGTQSIVTSQLVMIELFGFCCKLGEDVRLGCCQLVKGLNTMAHVTVVPYTDQQYDEAVQLYEQVSNDKRWSLVDCASFLIMEQLKITVVVTGDRHFIERGFVLLA